MMDAKGVRNVQSIPALVNKHNTAKVASCWLIIHYRLVMHGNLNIKYAIHHAMYLTEAVSNFTVNIFVLLYIT